MDAYHTAVHTLNGSLTALIYATERGEKEDASVSSPKMKPHQWSAMFLFALMAGILALMTYLVPLRRTDVPNNVWTVPNGSPQRSQK
jgi:hypothetical protein